MAETKKKAPAKKKTTTKAKAAPKKTTTKKAPIKKAAAAVSAAFAPGSLDPRQLGRMARAVVMALAESNKPGAEKHAEAVAAVARKVDAALVWPATPAGFVAEAMDGVAAQILLGAVVKHAYNALKSEGKIQ
jgi:hypothetical protein